MFYSEKDDKKVTKLANFVVIVGEEFAATPQYFAQKGFLKSKCFGR